MRTELSELSVIDHEQTMGVNSRVLDQKQLNHCDTAENVHKQYNLYTKSMSNYD